MRGSRSLLLAAAVAGGWMVGWRIISPIEDPVDLGCAGFTEELPCRKSWHGCRWDRAELLCTAPVRVAEFLDIEPTAPKLDERAPGPRRVPPEMDCTQAGARAADCWRRRFEGKGRLAPPPPLTTAAAIVRSPPGLSVPDRCGSVPLAVIGLWVFPGNAKHKPQFFTKRLYQTINLMRHYTVSTVVFGGGEEHSNGHLSEANAASAFNPKNRKGIVGWDEAFVKYVHSDVDSLPYKAQADAMPANCPAKYGKRLPEGQLKTLDKIWLSKPALVDAALSVEPDAACGAAGRTQWLWLDAGLEKDQVLRIMNHTKTLKAPSPGAVHMQFYCKVKMIPDAEYFAGRCPVKHVLNAKAIWTDRQGAKTLRAAFDACLGRLVASNEEGARQGKDPTSNCECFDEETVLTHIYQRLAPCAELPVARPTFIPMPVIAKCSE